jgi:peroxiredoxin Q/BCP
MAGLAVVLTLSPLVGGAAEKTPKVGDIAEDFELNSLSGEKVKLSKLTDAGPVVLVVLRGFPGYQCPVCNQQVGQFLADAEKFQAAGAQVLLVYPGAANKLNQRAMEFAGKKTMPDHFHLVIDPDYKFTTKYHLRWNEPQETAYPSTFVIQKDRKITFAKVSESHGGRVSPAEALKALMSK